MPPGIGYPNQQSGVPGPNTPLPSLGTSYTAGGINFNVPAPLITPTQTAPNNYSVAHTGTGPSTYDILNAYYGAGGEFYPGLFSDLGIRPPEPPRSQEQLPDATQLDPFFQLVMMLLYPNGLPGMQAEPQRGKHPQQQAPQASPLDSLLGGLGQIDPLLAMLLGVPQGPPPSAPQPNPLGFGNNNLLASLLGG